MDDPMVRRALAVVLMREVLSALDGLGEDVAETCVRSAIDSVMERVPTPGTKGMC